MDWMAKIKFHKTERLHCNLAMISSVANLINNFTPVNYDSRVVVTSKLLMFMTLDS